MEAENALINNFYIGFWLNLAVVIAIIISIVLLIIFKKKIFMKSNQSALSKVIFFSAIGLLFLVNTLFGFKFTLHCLDLKAVQNRNFETITGTVINYDKATSYENGTVDYSYPIIKIEGTDKTIILDAGQTELYKTYTFIYLKYTKIADIIGG
jgi:hypothetical protein